MRIAQLVENLDVGGLERMAVDLAIAHRKAGHESSIYALFSPGALAPEAAAAGVSVIPFHKKLGFSPRAILQIAARLRHDRIDVIHTHNSVVHHYGVFAAHLVRVPAIVNTRHGVSLVHTRPIQETYFRSMIPLTDQFTFVCEDGRRLFEARGVPRARSTVILNGIPLDKWASAVASPGSERPNIRCITVGRMVEGKGFDVLIDAFSLLLRRASGITLQFVGDGPLSAALRHRVREANLEAHISFAGSVSHPEHLMARADLFVLSSLSEGLPVVILEAMAAGLPVIATRVGGVPEVLTSDTGWLCEPGHAESLASAILAAANEPKLAAMGRAARGVVFAHFGIARVQVDYERLFSRLIDPDRRDQIADRDERRHAVSHPRGGHGTTRSTQSDAPNNARPMTLPTIKPNVDPA
jgi:glycosyltransferase involved in cell wall biosynthesis